MMSPSHAASTKRTSTVVARARVVCETTAAAGDHTDGAIGRRRLLPSWLGWRRARRKPVTPPS
eukprot:scaffold130807_cov30-Tisochrysis_lutea.AAC.2